MIKFNSVETYGWEAAIIGMRNPMDSWGKSDSKFVPAKTVVNGNLITYPCTAIIGDDDKRLMHNLIKAGSDHRKFMRFITVTVNITAPLYWWKEFDTYKVGTVANSCSTMHKIHSKPFEIDQFSTEHLVDPYLITLGMTIDALNEARDKYIKTKDKRYWWQMIQILPTSYNQMRTVQLNYEVLRNIYHSRKDHKLDEWHSFCEDFVKLLPYHEFITD